MAPSHQNGFVKNGLHGHSNGINGIRKEYHGGEKTWTYLTFKSLGFFLISCSSLFQWYFGLHFMLYPLVFLMFLVPVFVCFLGVHNVLYMLRNYYNAKSNVEKYVKFNDEKLKNQFKDSFIPIRDLYELYADGDIEFTSDVLQCLERRNEFVSYKLQWSHLKFFLLKFLPEMIKHDKKQDAEQVCEHYDRGNDFYEEFLGPLMVYTSGIRLHEDDTLEDMQRNKFKDVCEKIQLSPNEKHLDIGCGWGTLVNYAAENYGSQGTGVTLAANQVEWAETKAKEMGVNDRVKYLCMDYRDIPSEKYDKITCLEMSEHVGIRLYPKFLKQVSDMLEDDGLFYLQIAGLRRAWQWEDFLWGFFMDTYIFPGADASLPLTFPVSQLENAGFEVQSVNTIGVHYSDTLKNWYYNWVRPETKEKISGKYGIRLYRIWEIFLAWSTIIARQGNSTCYQIVAHKNFNHYPRRRFMKSNKEKDL